MFLQYSKEMGSFAKLTTHILVLVCVEEVECKSSNTTPLFSFPESEWPDKSLWKLLIPYVIPFHLAIPYADNLNEAISQGKGGGFSRCETTQSC